VREVVEAAGVPFSALTWGDPSARPLVLVHGVTASAAIWWRVGPALAATGRRVVAPDLPGHGRTGHWTGRPQFGHMAIDMVAWIRAAGLDRSGLQVIGHSYGAVVASHLPAAGLRPDTIVLLDPPVMPLDLLTRVGFDPADDQPVFGLIGRLDPQKGFDLVLDAAPAMLARGDRIVVLGSGHASLADPLRELAAAEPTRVAFIERFDRAMARRIYAGADLFVMPSRFEPCGQGQMIALRYGTPPVVHRTGGLADTVVDEVSAPGRGTGFVFSEESVEGLLAACAAAGEMRAGDPAAWTALRDRGMAVDFDWTTGSAPRYVEAYERAIELRRG